MRNREGNGGVQPAGAKGLDGRLWFPTQDGVVVVDPAHVRRDQRAPPLVVEQVVAGGRRASPGARLDRARARSARHADRVHRAHLPRADERPLPLPARSVRRELGRRGQPPHGVLHEGAAGPLHVPRRGERRRRRVVRAGHQARGARRPAVLGDGRLSLGVGAGVRRPRSSSAVRAARGAPPRARAAARARRRRAHGGAARARARARRPQRAAAIGRSCEDALLRQRVARAAHAAHAHDRAAGGSARARRRRSAGRALARHRAPQRAAPAAARESDPRRREARGGSDAPRAAPARPRRRSRAASSPRSRRSPSATAFA